MKLNNIFRVTLISQPLLVIIYLIYSFFYRQLNPVLEEWEISNVSETITSIDVLVGAIGLLLLISLIMLFFFIKYGREFYLGIHVVSVIYYILDTQPRIMTPIEFLIYDLIVIATGITLALLYFSPIKEKF